MSFCLNPTGGPSQALQWEGEAAHSPGTVMLRRAPLRAASSRGVDVIDLHRALQGFLAAGAFSSGWSAEDALCCEGIWPTLLLTSCRADCPSRGRGWQTT